MLRLVPVWLALAITAVSGDAFAFCSEPTKPWSKPTKPRVPYCVNEWSRTHTCADWEIDQYNRQVRRYNDEVEMYLQALQRYVNQAIAFAKCEAASLD